VTAVNIEYARDKDTGRITTTDVRLSHADTLMVREDGGEWAARSLDEPVVSEGMVIEFRAVDSSKKSTEGRPYRIDNSIDIQHELMASPTPGHQVLKVKVVPPTAKLLFTVDDSNPANNGNTYQTPGIDAPEDSTVRLFAEKGPVSRELSIPIPKDKDAGTEPQVDPAKPVTVNGKGFSSLVMRAATYEFLVSLPDDARLQKVQAKVTVAATDNTVTLTWDGKTRLRPANVKEAFEFLDGQLDGGEWWLRFDQLHFVTGQSLLQWQVDASTKIEKGQISQ
jgi:hypothetical protein